MLRIERGSPSLRTQLLLPKGQGERTIADTGTYYVVERLSEGHAAPATTVKLSNVTSVR